MKPPLKLQDLLQQGESAIAATSILIGQGILSLDCAGVESLTAVQLTQLFASIPETWDFTELGEVFDPSTLTDAFAQQLLEWTNKRLGIEPETTAHLPSPSPQTLCNRYFSKDGNPFRFYYHQEQAFLAAQR